MLPLKERIFHSQLVYDEFSIYKTVFGYKHTPHKHKSDSDEYKQHCRVVGTYKVCVWMLC